MKKKSLPIFIVLFFPLITISYGYPCSGAAYIDNDKTLVWVNFDKPEAVRALFENNKGTFGPHIMGFRYMGKKSQSPHISHGVNEHGLAIITMAAPDGVPCASTGDWLMKFKTVDETLNTIEGKSSYLGFHQFKILADRQKVALIEDYSSKEYKIVVVDRGHVGHTNHYTFPELSHYNSKLTSNSKFIAFSERRLQIIEDFLNVHEKTIESFKELSSRGPLNRTDTIVSMVVIIPHTGDKPKLIYRFPQSPDKDWVEVGF